MSAGGVGAGGEQAGDGDQRFARFGRRDFANDVSTDPVVATHHGLREFNDIPRNMPEWLLKKLAAKGGVIGFQIGNDFHNKKFFDYRTKQTGKAFWDTKGVA